MHAINRFLNSSGQKLWRQRSARLLAQGWLIVMAYSLLYLTGILLIKSMSLTWAGLLTVPLCVLAGLLILLPYHWWLLRDQRRVAKLLETQHPELALSVRTSLDFLEGKVDNPYRTPAKDTYVDQVNRRLVGIYVGETSSHNWGRFALTLLAMNLLVWGFFREDLLNKFYNPLMSFGQTHLNLNEGSITIFEPEYTQIPGRTLPLKPGTFQAYPGSKVRFMIQLPPKTKALYLTRSGDENPIPLRINDERQASYELVLLEDTEIRYLLSQSQSSGRTEPYLFKIKRDDIPEIQLRSYTPEGILNILDPLILEAEVKDDFGVKELEAVVSWEGGEKRVPILVPFDRKQHFLSKNQWYLSELGLEEVESFKIYLEAKDNNPIDGPGIGQSQALYYELESPDKKYDEFMRLARELLNTMTHTLGDNLETQFATTIDIENLQQAESIGKQINTGLYRSLDLTNKLIGKVRETPNLTRLDQSFLYQFRNGVSGQARARGEISLLYNNIQFRRQLSTYQRLRSRHKSEETNVENLTYELLLQLKMWAILELERQNNKLKEDLENLAELLENSENLEESELMDLFNQLMDEIMKNFQQMMSSAAQQMDMSMEEFMNLDAMEMNQDQFQELREQIMEALKQGDMEKAKALMQQLKDMMESAFSSMQNAMGQMSPEMQAMMKNMRELMGLLRELKTGEEDLERQTQNLKQRLDEEMGGNHPELSPSQQQYRKATERIQELLTDLSDRLAELKTEDISQGIIEQITRNKDRLAEENLDEQEIQRMRKEIAMQERLLNFLSRDGLDQLQNVTLKNLERTKQMQEYLDQNEFLLSLETGFKLETKLSQGESLSERSTSREMRETADPVATYREARQELYAILDALQNMKNNIEERRRDYMRDRQEREQLGLSQKQAGLDQMIQEFMGKTQDSFEGSQISDRLEDIAMSMKNAERRLEDARLEGGIHYEQEALQKIGELMEQLQQSSNPSGMPRPMRLMLGNKREGNMGDPLIKDFFIPESQKQISRNQMKDAIRKQLDRNLPDAYGKEIRKYYEKLMDQ